MPVPGEPTGTHLNNSPLLVKQKRLTPFRTKRSLCRTRDAAKLKVA
jgi:hypothetical protein